MKITVNKLLSTSILLCFSCLSWSQDMTGIDLSGYWKVKTALGTHTVKLPGSLTENSVGYPVTDSITKMLTQPVRYEGEATYEKEIDIPASWEGKCIELYMERTRISEVFVNQHSTGSCNSVSTPHVYRIKDAFKPGINRLQIVVNNKRVLPLGNSHIWSDDIQTNWNGILGDFYLRCLEDVEVSNTRIDAAVTGECLVRLNVLNTTSNQTEKTINLVVTDSSGYIVAEKQIHSVVPSGEIAVNIDLAIANPLLWDEYHPHIYQLEIRIAGNRHSWTTSFGFRDFNIQSGKFVNNGRRVFLRGKHDAGVFPLTGYASMKKEDWTRYFAIAKSYGINHVRYHTWTPSGAAFEAADELGIFLQPELPVWNTVTASNTQLINYMKAEGQRILEAYGNHPSFVMFTLGNELHGETETMSMVVSHLKTLDKRHLYANGSNNFFANPKPCPGEDFFVSMRFGKVSPDNHTDLRGSFAYIDSDAKGGIINNLKPATNRNFGRAIKDLEIPAVGHETGQYQTFPIFEEIEKYTGVLQPRNLEVFRKKLAQTGMLPQTNDFVKASGALSALCYREDIELALRTPGFGGFQLLDLQDYPGQGTALVGILDVFMDSKGIIEREKWREFCNDIVPLALFPKYCWTTDETYTADVAVAHYGEKDLLQETVVCRLETQHNKLLYEKVFSGRTIVQGDVSAVGSIQIPLNKIKTNQKLRFTVMLKKSGYTNSWDIWAYAKSKKPVQEGYIGKVFVTQDRNQCEQVAATGKPVLYIPHPADIESRSVKGLFISDFWNYQMFHQISERQKAESSPGTLGILTNPDHPIFNTFPTNFHTDWQWWNIIKHAHPVILDHYPPGYKPVVQMIDNVYRNHKLGLIYEEPGAKGKVLVCTSDLFAIKDEPEVQALFNSLVTYLENEK
ncbi:Beta-galactosidase [termite gut metagenome]|uniref:Beta-galactosidase n=1 Tax=termite gut metagenome TaxID=433724 RepID=A0A5J4RQ73_9ZZZZ